jgi:hypothetical protein
MELTKVYLKVNQNGETVNVFATVGRAIDDLSLESVRIDKNLIVSKTLSALKWRGRDGKIYSYEIKECPICKDISLDYMCYPRVFTL